ncbi:MAG TPA: tetratricopeptide repeat protein [Chryseolinea sp.]|nr:tetratricopeptide repeat protein [Chryseolinea sp.]
MQPNLNSDEVRQRKKVTRHFILGYIFLLAMALSWSVDDSIVYILFGIGIFFIFLGFYSRPRRNTSQQSYRTSGSTRSASAKFENPFENIFRKHQATTQASGTSKNPSTPEANRRVATLVVFAVFAIFILFFIGSIFSSEGEWDESTLYFQNAQGQYWDGNYDSALINYRKAWRLNDEYADAFVGYGNVLAAQGQADSAVIMFDKALRIRPDYKEAGYSKASALNNQQKYNEAIAVLKPFLEENPDYYDAMLVMGDSYYLQKQYDEAIVWYANAYENGEVRSHALSYIMAYIYDTKGDYGRAIDLYKEALSYDSSVVDIYKRLGELLPNEEGNYYRTQASRSQQP